MARDAVHRDISQTLKGAETWTGSCLIQSGSLFSADSLWTSSLVDEVYQNFVEHPDSGPDDFMTKLRRQMERGSPSARQLMAEMLWSLLLFPSNIKPRTKRRHVTEIWSMSGESLSENHSLLSDDVLSGIGSGGPGFNNYRPNELEYLILLVRDLKRRAEGERSRILTDYDGFLGWIDLVPRKGRRQFRHMLRFFAFPDRVERISSDNDRRKILEAFGSGSARETSEWSDRQMDEKLLELRVRLQGENPSTTLDFYNSPLKERWSGERTIKTVEGEVTVVVPSSDDEAGDVEVSPIAPKVSEIRQSIQIQSKLARIGAAMGFRVWIAPGDRGRVAELLSDNERASFSDHLPLNYDDVTLGTIELIDVLWLKGRSIVRAFEVEHTTAVYSGLLRMADLLALQPNMEIRLHIVAAEDRREKVFREMRRPVFSLLDRGPLSKNCTFISYESVDEISGLQHLAHTSESIIAEHEERAE